MKHDISRSIAYKVSDSKYSIKLLKELEDQFPWLRWQSGYLPSKNLTKELIYVIEVGLTSSKLLYCSSGILPSYVTKVVEYPGKTLREKIKEFKI